MKFNKQQWQWIFYDWANSGYGILVVTAVLPVYFKALLTRMGSQPRSQRHYGDMPTVRGLWSFRF